MIVDLDLNGLSSETNPEHLKRVSGAKHIISVQLNSNSIKNSCTGTGRVKIRLNDGENLDVIKLRFIEAGYDVKDHDEKTTKKSQFTSNECVML